LRYPKLSMTLRNVYIPAIESVCSMAEAAHRLIITCPATKISKRPPLAWYRTIFLDCTGLNFARLNFCKRHIFCSGIELILYRSGVISLQHLSMFSLQKKDETRSERRVCDLKRSRVGVNMVGEESGIGHGFRRVVCLRVTLNRSARVERITFRDSNRLRSWKTFIERRFFIAPGNIEFRRYENCKR
jgi:hypothetical protein